MFFYAVEGCWGYNSSDTEIYLATNSELKAYQKALWVMEEGGYKSEMNVVVHKFDEEGNDITEKEAEDRNWKKYFCYNDNDINELRDIVKKLEGLNA